MTFYLFSRDDEAEIARVSFDAAQTAITLRIKVDLTGVRRDACVSQVHFESDQLWFRSRLAAFEFSREDAGTAGRIDYYRCGVLELLAVELQLYASHIASVEDWFRDASVFQHLDAARL